MDDTVLIKAILAVPASAALFVILGAAGIACQQRFRFHRPGRAVLILASAAVFVVTMHLIGLAPWRWQ